MKAFIRWGEYPHLLLKYGIVKLTTEKVIVMVHAELKVGLITEAIAKVNEYGFNVETIANSDKADEIAMAVL